MKYVRQLTVTPSDYYVAEMLDDCLDCGARGMRVAQKTLDQHTDFAFRELYVRRLARMKRNGSPGRRMCSLVRRILRALMRVYGCARHMVRLLRGARPCTAARGNTA